MNLLQNFDTLLQGWRTVFSQQRIFDRARRLTFGMLISLRSHLTSTAICTGGRQFVDWSADYRLCSRSPWNPHQLFDPVFDHFHSLLDSPTAPVLAAIDDTLCKKTGRKIPGVSTARDPQSLKFHLNLCRGLRFQQISLLVAPPAAVPGPARALPVHFDLAPPVPKPRQDASQEVWKNYRAEKKKRSLTQAGVHSMAGVRLSLDARPQTASRQLIICGDSTYTNQTTLQHLPPRTTYIGRIRKDAKLCFPLPPASATAPAKGRPRLYGPPAPTPEQFLKDPALPVVKVSCFAAGELRDMPVKVVRHLYWSKAGAQCPLTLVIIKPLGYRLRKGSKVLYRDPAFLICTDPDLDLQLLVQAYVYRWEIECNHRDEKSLLGVARGQVRNPHAVRRLPQLQVAGYSLLLLASLLTSGFQRTSEYLPLPKWRHKSARPSLLDLLALLRDQIFARGSAAPPLLNFDDFQTAPTPVGKSSKPPLAPGTLCTLAA